MSIDLLVPTFTFAPPTSVKYTKMMAMPHKPIAPRIFGIVARDAPVVAVLRSGPAKQTQLLRWDLKTLEVQPGQWIKGKVHEKSCELSGDGSLLLCLICNYKEGRRQQTSRRLEVPGFTADCWAAISRPPYFSAVALRFMTYRWVGGIWLRGKSGELEEFSEEQFLTSALAKEHSELSQQLTNRFPPYEELLEKRGWRRNHGVVDSLAEWSLKVNGGSIVRVEREGRNRITSRRDEKWMVIDNSGNEVITWEWAPAGRVWIDRDQRGRTLLGHSGCLFICEDVSKSSPKMIADLNASVFEEVVAPEAFLRL